MGRKTIAVFISALYEDMVRQTVEGLLSAARGEDMKILFFTSFADNHTSEAMIFIRITIRVTLLSTCCRI